MLHQDKELPNDSGRLSSRRQYDKPAHLEKCTSEKIKFKNLCIFKYLMWIIKVRYVCHVLILRLIGICFLYCRWYLTFLYSLISRN